MNLMAGPKQDKTLLNHNSLNGPSYLNHLPHHGVARDDVLLLLRLDVTVVQGHQLRQAHL